MQYQWVYLVSLISDLILFSAALLAISGKLGWKRKWEALVPGLRFYRLGATVRMGREGMYCGVMDILLMASMVYKLVAPAGRVMTTVVSLINMVFFLFLFIYRIRIFLQILELFGLGKKWIILWLLINWLPLFILGLGKKYQPVKSNALEENWEAGEKPAEIPATGKREFKLAKEGLGVQIRERTVKDFGKKRYLLKDIALNIPKKSLVLLLGGSGAGKTTLLNALIGYEKADATILLNGEDVYKDYKRVKYKIGFVPQQNLIRGKDTVIRTVDDSALIRIPKNVSGKERKQKLKEVMDLLGLTAGQGGLVAKKSGGQLRRICIAMELVSDPDLFVLDEPDSGLDGVISREIFMRLREIADEDRIVLVITHTPDRVIDLFDKVIVLGRDSGRVGRLAFYGSPDEAKAFFGKESMEEIVMSVTSEDEGGEGRADEMIEKYATYAAEREGGMAS